MSFQTEHESESTDWLVASRCCKDCRRSSASRTFCLRSYRPSDSSSSSISSSVSVTSLLQSTLTNNTTKQCINQKTPHNNHHNSHCYILAITVQYTPPTLTRLSCQLELRWRCVWNSQLVGNRLDESEQISQQRSRVVAYQRCERTHRKSWPSLQFPVLFSYWGWWRVTTSLSKKLSISIKIHVVKPLLSLFPNCWPNLSAVVVGKLRILFTPPTLTCCGTN